jgi:hypothetical protein
MQNHVLASIELWMLIRWRGDQLILAQTWAIDIGPNGYQSSHSATHVTVTTKSLRTIYRTKR